MLVTLAFLFLKKNEIQLEKKDLTLDPDPLNLNFHPAEYIFYNENIFEFQAFVLYGHEFIINRLN